MDASTLYGIALLSILAARVLWQHRDKLISGTRLPKGHIEHRVLVSRGLWSSATITIPGIVSLLLFIAVNVLLSVCGGHLANLAVINFLPLYLGGRTNFQADYLGIPLPVYQLLHRWLARVFIVQSLIHSGQNLSSSAPAPQVPKPFVACGLLEDGLTWIHQRHPLSSTLLRRFIQVSEAAARVEDLSRWSVRGAAQPWRI